MVNVPNAFGSLSDRFKEKRVMDVPGPGSYNVDMAVDNINEPRVISTIVGTLRKAELYGKTGSGEDGDGGGVIDPVSIRVPVFGSQAQRFQTRVFEDPLPPPGAYEISDAFDRVKKRGEILTTNALASKTRRILYKANDNVPGPGQYDPVMGDKKTFTSMAKQARGGAMPSVSADHHHHAAAAAAESSQERFVERIQDGPSPGTYEIPSTITKRSYNITLGTTKDR